MDGQISMCRGLPTNALSAILNGRGLASLVTKALWPESGSSVSGPVQGLRRWADETGRGREIEADLFRGEIDRLNERLAPDQARDGIWGWMIEKESPRNPENRSPFPESCHTS